MLRGQPVTAVIPVRGGSKGIPGKNLYRLGRDTLLERTIKIAKLCPYVDRVLVSTDNREMFDIAQRYTAAAPTLRPAELATDNAKTVDVVLNLIETAPIPAGWVLLLQVTSPLRTLGDLNDFCRTFEEADPAAEAIVSLVQHDSPHPDKIQKIDNGIVVSYLGKESMVARQLLPKVYSLNGAFYLTHRDILIERRTFMPAQTIPFIMPEERSLNLDGKLDLFLLEALLEKGRIVLEEY
ncbi:MAG: acylneuraminate cytidylyltransferase family protein [Gammaproteobacteria bacterium]|nr:acylneuraminate cytidylyltransferase family protein [Gammaproteobacteria bacterium]MBU1481668.1 acylneuraminate cytidylyltransferase family protein [Gammaproteobacteria bacterium]